MSMTYQQLEWIRDLIDLKCEVAVKIAMHQSVSNDTYERIEHINELLDETVA